MADSETTQRFPFINLEKAVGRAKQLYDADQRGNDMSTEGAFAVWEYSAKSSGGFQTIGALKYYGLLTAVDSGKVKLSKEGLAYFKDEREEERTKLLQQFAVKPAFLASLWNKWGSQPPGDALARTYLKVERNLSEQNARQLLGIYKDNLAFANLRGDAKVIEQNAGKGHDEKPAAKAKVGDYVQWTSGDVDQFDKPRPVVWVDADQSHLRVVGSMTGIPMHETTVVSPPVNPPPIKQESGGVRIDPASEDINVLLTSQGRLQITADVDLEGLKKLKQMLVKYEEILDLF